MLIPLLLIVPSGTANAIHIMRLTFSAYKLLRTESQFIASTVQCLYQLLACLHQISSHVPPYLLFHYCLQIIYIINPKLSTNFTTNCVETPNPPKIQPRRVSFPRPLIYLCSLRYKIRVPSKHFPKPFPCSLAHLYRKSPSGRKSRAHLYRKGSRLYSCEDRGGGLLHRGGLRVVSYVVIE